MIPASTDQFQGQLSKSGQKEFEEALIASLDLEVWNIERDLSSVYNRNESEIFEGIKDEELVIQTIRNEILPQLKDKRPELPFSGIQEFSMDQIQKAHLGLLFNGGVTAVDGTRATHDSLPITISQIGVCMVSYNGEYGSYAHRLFRRDLRLKGGNLVEEVMDLLEIRKERSGQGQEDSFGRFSELTQRGLMAYAERAILMHKAESAWRMGHGHPFPYELLVNFWASNIDVTNIILGLFKKIMDHKRFVFVPSAPPRHLITVGNALKEREFVLIETAKKKILQIIEEGKAHPTIKKIQSDFFQEQGDNLVIGLFKSSDYAPAHVFYAHRDFAQTAALIAIADGILQEQRGFPMLIDLADQICYSTFHPETFFASIRQAYAEAGQPFRFLGERETRNR